MMLPNQITSQTFSQNGKGGFKADEVTAFLQRVAQSYSRLYAEKKALSDKIDTLMPKVEEYERSKATIADALIWAKATAEKNIEEANGIAQKTLAEATEKAEKLLEEKRLQADAYYSEKTATADRNVEKARAEFENLKQQSELYADRYIAEINVKAQTVIEDANSKAASIVSAAYADAQKAREKADRIIASANSELYRLLSEAETIKNQIASLITYAQNAAEQIDTSLFAPVEASESSVEQEVEAKSVDASAVESFSFDGIPGVSVTDVEQPEVAADDTVAQPDSGAQPGYVRFFGADIPDVNDILSGIFSAVSDAPSQTSGDATDDDEPAFRFEKVVSDFDAPLCDLSDEDADENNSDNDEDEPAPFSYLRKDSE